MILVRELDERLGLEAIIAAHLSDSRHGLNTQFRLPDLLRQSIYSRLAGCDDLNDAARVSTDPTFCLIGSPTRWDRSAALTSTLHWFETELLTREENLVGLMAVNRDVIGQVQTFDRADRVVLDMDPARVRYMGSKKSWVTPRRIVAKVEHHVGELFPRIGFIVTNLPLPNRAVVRFYNKRGTAEQWIKEGKQAAHWTRLSCHRFRANEVRLQLSVLAYNLGNLWRRLVLPRRIDSWSLTSLQQRLVKTGGRLVRHARYYWLLLAESHLTRRLFESMLQRIWALPVPTG